MQAVLYTHQLEPITVVDLPMWMWQQLQSGRPIRLEVMEPLSTSSLRAVVPLTCQMRMVEIFAERFRRNGCETLMLFTSDEESALLLKADFLPGQRSELQSRELGAFARGFFKALMDLPPIDG